MDSRDDRLIELVSDYLWRRMDEMREAGCETVEAQLALDGDVLRGDVRAVRSRPVDHITLTFKVT